MPIGPGEKVLCVPRGDVRRLLKNHAQYDDGDDALVLSVDEPYGMDGDAIYSALLERAEFRPRAEVEDDFDWKQVIPYVAVTIPRAVWVYTRGQGGGEGRLHALESIGVGGHVNPRDVGDRGLTRRGVEAALMRELQEEVTLLAIPAIALRGVVDSDEEGVGRHHVGIVYDCRLDTPDLDVREEGVLCGGAFVDFDAACARPERFEPWSRLVLEHLIP